MRLFEKLLLLYRKLRIKFICFFKRVLRRKLSIFMENCSFWYKVFVFRVHRVKLYLNLWLRFYCRKFYKTLNLIIETIKEFFKRG